MRIAACAGLLACALSIACTRPRPVQPERAFASAAALAVVSWNLRAGAGDLERLIEDLGTGRWTEDVPAAAFVLLLQEAVRNDPSARDAAAIAARGNLSFYFEPVRQRGDGEQGNALMATVPLESPRTVELPVVRQRRVALVTYVTAADTRLLVANVHLENRISWWRGGLFSEGARGRQARALLEALPRGVPGVLGGDLNTWLGAAEPAWRAILERFPDAPPAPSEPTFRERLVLDHVFFDLPPGWTARRNVVPERYGSDHHPVVGLLHAPDAGGAGSAGRIIIGRHSRRPLRPLWP